MSDIQPARYSAHSIHEIAAALREKFSLPEAAVKVQRPTRLWVEVDQTGFPAVFDGLVRSMGFSILCTITGLDLGADLGIIYHVAQDGGIVANVKTRCAKGSSIRTVTPYFPGAENYERELIDLLGAKVEGLPPGPRYPLPDGWPEGEHPLLKDWQPKGAEEPATPGAAPAAQPAAPAAAQGAQEGAPRNE
jgi:Ni,Fe-hydrogenase III component G